MKYLDFLVGGLLVATAARYRFGLGGRVHAAGYVRPGFLAVIALYVILRLELPWFGLLEPEHTVSFLSICATVLGVLVWFLLRQRRESDNLFVMLGGITGLTFLAGGLWTGVTVQAEVQSLAYWFYPHVAAASLALASSFVAAVIAVLFLMQDKALKAGNFDLVERLPRLDTLSAMLTRSIELGALFFTITILLGSALSVYVWSRPFSADPFTLTAWLGFAAQLSLYIVQLRFGWASRRLAMATLSVYVFWIALLIAAGTVLPTEHSGFGL